MVDRPRCLDWTPLATQQLRLRNLIQIIGCNVNCGVDASYLYYTLHSTPMSSPFFKSSEVEVPQIDGGDDEVHVMKQVLWPEINCEKMAKSAAECVCIRVWERTRLNENKVLFLWGVYFSGLVSVVRKTDARYRTNTIIFQMHGGLFASADSFDSNYAISKVAFPHGLPNFTATTTTATNAKTPTSDNNGKLIKNISSNCDETLRLRNSLKQLNATPNRNLLAIKSSPDLSSFLWNGSPMRSPSSSPSMTTEQWEARSTDTRLMKFRYIQMGFKSSDCRPSYSVNKLLLLQQKQRQIKYQLETNLELRDKICTKSAYCLNLEMVSNRSMMRAQQIRVPGMGRELSRLLYQQEEPAKPEDILRGQDLRRQIETAKFRCETFQIARDELKERLQELNNNLEKISNENVTLESETMAGWRKFSREKAEFPTKKTDLEQLKDTFNQTMDELSSLRRKLLRDLKQIYTIRKLHNGLYAINDAPLPNAESYRNYSVAPADISVALGFTAHVIILCSQVLKIPLRNNIIFYGSESKIEDNIKPIPEKDRSFPMYFSKNPASNPLLYGVFLLNQNINQIKYELGLRRGDTRATLPNLLDILDGIPSPVRLPAKTESASSDLSQLPYSGPITPPIEISSSKSQERICRSLDPQKSHLTSSSDTPTFKHLSAFSTTKRFGSEPTLCENVQQETQSLTSSNSSSGIILEEHVDDNNCSERENSS